MIVHHLLSRALFSTLIPLTFIGVYFNDGDFIILKVRGRINYPVLQTAREYLIVLFQGDTLRLHIIVYRTALVL
jgi:hypothetical protein